MDFKMGVLFVHGMGNQGPDFANGMIDELKERVRRKGGDPRQIAFESAWWAPVLAQKQENLIRFLADGNDLDWMELRRFVMHSLADAIAYQDTYRPSSDDQINVYRQVHDTFGEAMARLRGRLREGAAPDAPEAPLVIVAHSLGCHMITNYIWDTRNPDEGEPRPDNAFERFETLAGMVTFGCNIPVFTLAYTNLEPIRFPTPGAEQFFRPTADRDEVAKAQQWLNFYDPDDILGYPLRSMDPAYAKTVTADIAVNVGGLLRSWNPASHTAYWTDNDVTKPVADLLHGILRLL